MRTSLGRTIAVAAAFGGVAPTQDAKSVEIVHRIESPYQSRPTQIRVLVPDDLDAERRYRVVYVLPVEAGNGRRFGDGLREVEKLGLHDELEVIVVAPTFAALPWYADHPEDAGTRQESHFVEVVVPFVEREYPALAQSEGRLLVGFSKSGWGVFSLLLRHPNRFGCAAAWDAPMAMKRFDRYGAGVVFGTQENFEAYRIERSAKQRAEHFAGPEARLILLGIANFRADHEAMRAAFLELGIAHVYEDGPQRAHVWGSGWLEGAVRKVVSGPFVGGVAVREIVRRMGRDEAAAIFARGDDDSSGALDREEFRAGSGLAERDLADRVFTAIDRSRDGTVDLEELRTILRRWSRR